MNSHLTQGIAAITVCQFLESCIERGMVDEILHKSYSIHETDQIKQAIQEIADQQRRVAEYHKNALWPLVEEQP